MKMVAADYVLYPGRLLVRVTHRGWGLSDTIFVYEICSLRLEACP